MAGSYDSFVLFDTHGVMVDSPPKLLDLLAHAQYAVQMANQNYYSLGFDPDGASVLDLLACCVRCNILCGYDSPPVDISHVEFAQTLEYYEEKYLLKVCGHSIGYLANLCRVTNLN